MLEQGGWCWEAGHSADLFHMPPSQAVLWPLGSGCHVTLCLLCARNYPSSARSASSIWKEDSSVSSARHRGLWRKGQCRIWLKQRKSKTFFLFECLSVSCFHGVNDSALPLLLTEWDFLPALNKAGSDLFFLGMQLSSASWGFWYSTVRGACSWMASCFFPVCEEVAPDISPRHCASGNSPTGLRVSPGSHQQSDVQHSQPDGNPRQCQLGNLLNHEQPQRAGSKEVAAPSQVHSKTVQHWVL